MYLHVGQGMSEGGQGKRGSEVKMRRKERKEAPPTSKHRARRAVRKELLPEKPPGTAVHAGEKQVPKQEHNIRSVGYAYGGFCF